MTEPQVAGRWLTQGPDQHFFGYYDKEQFDPGDRFVLGLATAVRGRPPQPGDAARVGVIDLAGDGDFRVLGETRAWCWQQGAMLQWLPGRAQTFFYNDQADGAFVTVVQALDGQRRQLPRPTYAVSADGLWGLSLNFARLAQTRPGYGYVGLPDPWAGEAAPADDGIYLLNMASGEHRLVISLARAAASDPLATMEDAAHWFNHLLFAPGGARFVFLHRWRSLAQSDEGYTTIDVDGRSIRIADQLWRFQHSRMYVADRDGGNLVRVPVERPSHFIWAAFDELLVWGRTPAHGPALYRWWDGSDEAEPVDPQHIVRDGHFNVRPALDWLLGDGYSSQQRLLGVYLYRLPGGPRVDLAEFGLPADHFGELRCDLHPRWSRSGRYVCLDAVREGLRQLHLLDVGAVTGEVE